MKVFLQKINKKCFFVFLFYIFDFAILFSQIKITKAEDFEEGLVLEFQECKPDSVFPGPSGKNQIWDFSNLKPTSNKITQKIMSIKSTSYDDYFPDAQLAEVNSDGTFVFFRKTKSENYLVGFADERQEMTMKYVDNMIFMKRPIQFGDSISDTFRREYSTSYFEFKGNGTVTIVADGYGKLILPNKTYDKVLRVKIVQESLDTLDQYKTKNKTTNITYLWFNNENKSTLLKINELTTPFFTNKTVLYLLSETNEKKKKN